MYYKGAGMKDNVTSIEYIPIEEIKAYENNPRKNQEAVTKVAQSIKQYGIRVPAIIDKDNVLIAGHTRVQAAISLGIKEYPCVRADDLTHNEAKAFRLADNRIQEDGEWDIDALSHEFDALKQTGFDLSGTGFEEFEIDGIDLSAQEDAVIQAYNSEDNDTPPDSDEDYDMPEIDDKETQEILQALFVAKRTKTKTS